MAEPLTFLLKWLCEEQADITGKELAEISGIAPQTWSKVRQGKQDLSSDLLWRILKAIAVLRSNSEAARVVAIVEGKYWSRPTTTQTLSDLIQIAEDNELEAAMIMIVRRMFPRHHTEHQERVKSPII